MFLRLFGWSLAVTAASLITAYLYGGLTALALCAILGVLEVSLSFDNAVVNASVLRRMSRFWQQIFLTVGILIAVFGMRLVFPILIVSAVSGLGPVEAVELALAGGGVDTPGTYANILDGAHPQIAGFGGMFLLMLFLNYMLDGDREHLWLRPVERVLGKVGGLDKASVLIASVVLLLSSQFLAEDPGEVLLAGLLGLITYLVVNGLGTAFEGSGSDGEGSDDESSDHAGPSGLAVVAGRAAFFLFLYLEVLDATFSFDGVIGAFAITSDPIVIALGLGLIGAIFVRSITVFLVRQGTLDDYVYLESGAHWAIGALALILLLTIGVEVNAVVTGLVGVVIIAAAFVSSLIHNRRHDEADGDGPSPGPAAPGDEHSPGPDQPAPGPDGQSSDPGRHSSDPGRHSSDPGRHSSDPGRHSSDPGRHSSGDDEHAPGPAVASPVSSPATNGTTPRPLNSG